MLSIRPGRWAINCPPYGEDMASIFGNTLLITQ
jgi:hypothetical protein